MIIRYYHGNINFDTLEELCKTTKRGTNAYHLIEAGNFIGLQGKGFRLDLNQIQETKIPCIVHVTTKQNYEHFMVLYKICKNYVIVADPAIGIQKVKKEIFEKMFNRTILVFKPIRILPQEQNRKNMITFIKNIIFQKKSKIFFILVYSLLSITLIMTTSFSIQFFLIGIEKNDYFYILSIFVIFLILNGLKFIFMKLKDKQLLRFNMNLDATLSKETFQKIVSLPYQYYRNKTSGEVMSRFEDIPMVNNLIVDVFIEGILSILLALGAFVGLFCLNRILSIFALLIFLFIVGISLIVTPLLKKNIRKVKKKREEYISFTYEVFHNYETIKGNHQEFQMQKQFEKVYYEYYKEYYAYQKLIQYIRWIRQWIDQVSQLLLLFIGCNMILKKQLSLTKMLTFEFIFHIFLGPAYEFLDKAAIIKDGIESFHKLADLFVDSKKEGFVDKDIQGNIKISHLNFFYDDKIILNDVNLDIHAKEKIMIVGESGVGKSTLFHLLMGYIKAPRNTIFIDEIDINDYERNSLEKQIRMISQNENLFTDTIYNNLTFFEKKNAQKIIQSCDLCEISSLISKNPLGYFMPLEENGMNISGGERQRFVLARTLLLKFNILLIDEGLSQVDEDKERKILKNVFEKYADKTILVISHRFRNVDLFDRVIHLEKGVPIGSN